MTCFTQPPNTNHFSNVFVFHKASKVLMEVDTVMYMQCVVGQSLARSHHNALRHAPTPCHKDPQLLMGVFGFGDFTMHFHPSIKGPGLYPTAAASHFKHLISAHTGSCFQKLHRKRGAPYAAACSASVSFLWGRALELLRAVVSDPVATFCPCP
jgi:hypothetical protein